MKPHVLPFPTRPQIVDEHGPCQGVDPNLFCIAKDHGGPSESGKTALHICQRHCPGEVRRACHEWAEEAMRRGYPWPGFVVGGVRYVSASGLRSGPADRTYKPDRKGCPICIEGES